MYNVIFLGNAGVGKTTYIEKIFSGKFNPRYDCTLAMEVHPVKVNDIDINIWDYAGQCKLSLDIPNIDIHIAVIFYSTDSKLSMESIQYWIDRITSVSPVVKILIVATKNDILPNKCYYSQTDMTLSTKNDTVPQLKMLLQQIVNIIQ